jgi:hypothetical protein
MLVMTTSDRRDFYIRHYLEDIRLLCVSDLRGFFPTARIIRERFLGWTKSLIATGDRRRF